MKDQIVDLPTGQCFTFMYGNFQILYLAQETAQVGVFKESSRKKLFTTDTIEKALDWINTHEWIDTHILNFREYSCNNLKDIAEIIDEVRVNLLVDFDESGISPIAEQYFLSVLDHLSLATRNMKLAHFNQIKGA